VRYLITISLLLITLSGGAQTLPSPDTLTALMRRAGVPGMQLVYARRGTTRTYSLGVRQAGSPLPVTAQTIFEGASLGKAMLAYVALRLLDRGIFDLDRPLLTYYAYPRLLADQADQANSKAARITARLVLTHRSGLPNWEVPPTSPAWQTSPLTLRYPPDSCWSYSGEGFTFLQKTLEHLTHKSFETLAQEEIFRPLGLRHSTFQWQASLAAQAASGHDDQSRPQPISHFAAPYGAFSLLTTAADYSHFLQALLRGQGLKPATARLLLTPLGQARRCDHAATPTDAAIAWAAGVGLATTRRGLAQWQWGDNGSFKGFFLTLPGQQQSLVFLTNSSNGPKMAEQLLRLFFGPGQDQALRWLRE